MTDTLFDPMLGTKAVLPSGDIAIDDGSVPTLISVTRVLVSRSKTATEFAPLVPFTTKA